MPPIPWLFPGKEGAHQTDLKHFWAAVSGKAQLTGVRLHDLRHTHASILASLGMSLPLIGALLAIRSRKRRSDMHISWMTRCGPPPSAWGRSSPAPGRLAPRCATAGRRREFVREGARPPPDKEQLLGRAGAAGRMADPIIARRAGLGGLRENLSAAACTETELVAAFDGATPGRYVDAWRYEPLRADQFADLLAVHLAHGHLPDAPPGDTTLMADRAHEFVRNHRAKVVEALAVPSNSIQRSPGWAMRSSRWPPWHGLRSIGRTSCRRCLFRCQLSRCRPRRPRANRSGKASKSQTARSIGIFASGIGAVANPCRCRLQGPGKGPCRQQPSSVRIRWDVLHPRMSDKHPGGRPPKNSTVNRRG